MSSGLKGRCFCGATYRGQNICDEGANRPREKLGRGSWHKALSRLHRMDPGEMAQRYPELSLFALEHHVDKLERDLEEGLTSLAELEQRGWGCRARSLPPRPPQTRQLDPVVEAEVRRRAKERRELGEAYDRRMAREERPSP